MPPESPISAVARDFLLTALGTMLGVFSSRLGRIIDRARAIAERALNATAFVGSVLRFDFHPPVAWLFVPAMLAFVGALLAFPAEVLVAVRSVDLRLPAIPRPPLP